MFRLSQGFRNLVDVRLVPIASRANPNDTRALRTDKVSSVHVCRDARKNVVNLNLVGPSSRLAPVVRVGCRLYDSSLGDRDLVSSLEARGLDVGIRSFSRTFVLTHLTPSDRVLFQANFVSLVKAKPERQRWL